MKLKKNFKITTLFSCLAFVLIFLIIVANSFLHKDYNFPPTRIAFMAVISFVFGAMPAGVLTDFILDLRKRHKQIFPKKVRI